MVSATYCTTRMLIYFSNETVLSIEVMSDFYIPVLDLKIMAVTQNYSNL